MSFGKDDIAPSSRSSKNKRRTGEFAEDFDQGARLRWPKPPNIVVTGNTIAAPSAVGRVTMIISGTPFVRFVLDNGEISEPFCPVPGQPCEVIKDTY